MHLSTGSYRDTTMNPNCFLALLAILATGCSVFDPDCDVFGVVYAYSLNTGTTRQISSHDEIAYRYTSVVGVVK